VARDEVRVSLFPFMSVLACTIGALMLLLASLSLSAVTPRDAAPPAAQDPSPRPAPAEDANAAERESVARVESLFARVDRALASRGDARSISLGDLESELASARQGRKLGSDLAALAAAEQALEKERDVVETSIAVLESRRETLPILIDPTGLSRHLEPWFVECHAGGATAYRASDGFSVVMPREELSASLDYGRYLRRLSVTPGALLVLLIRPDGLRTAAIAHDVAVATGVRVATLPLPGNGELDWSLLQRAEGGGTR
jgi:hypothetical protein